MNISILGGGRWALALATHFVKKNSVKIWEFFPDKALAMQATRNSDYLTGGKIAEGIEISSNLEGVVKAGAVIVVAVPSDKVAVTLEKCQQYIDYKPVILCSKGFASDGRLLADVAGQYVRGEIYCMYGPTVADEVYKFQFTGVVLAGRTKNHSLQKALEDPDFKIELSDDIVGVQVASALNNILAIYIGMLDGMGQGENAKSYVITKGLNDFINFGVALGAKKETFNSIAGIGDIITTCYSSKSRNRSFGQQIGKGQNATTILSGAGDLVEGVSALKVVKSIADKNGIEVPLISGLYNVIFDNADPLTLMRSLR